MGEKDQNRKKSFEVIREGFARARFGGQFSGGIISGETSPLTLAAVENNGGLDPAEYFVCLARLLSAATTPYRKFDFSRDGVLKAAVPLFEGLTLYANHWADVESWKGFIQEPVWDDQNTPNGINAKVVLDRTVDPKLARGVETKALRSFSVTIWFTFERSHPDLAGFWDRLGEEVDGEMVRLIVTEITNAGEVSVVWEGEDPYAKSFEAGDNGHTNHHEEGNNMKLSAAFLTFIGLAVGAEPSEAELEAKIRENFQALETKVTTLETKASTLEGEAAALKVDATIGKQTLSETRERAVTLYKAAKGEKVVETFISGVIEKADLDTARALCTEYQTEVDKSIPLACPKCGEKLSRRSSQPEDQGKQLSGKRPEHYKVS